LKMAAPLLSNRIFALYTIKLFSKTSCGKQKGPTAFLPFRLTFLSHWGQTNFCKAKANQRGASVAPCLQCQGSDGSARGTNRTPDAWQIMEALRYLRQGLGTHLAIERGKPRGENRPICEEIRIPFEILQKGNVRHLRQMAAAGWQMMR
jgi:hypothetical protein